MTTEDRLKAAQVVSIFICRASFVSCKDVLWSSAMDCAIIRTTWVSQTGQQRHHAFEEKSTSP